MKKINAVVVTYNRKDLLRECLNSLLNQSYKLNKIIVLNNNSNDGTIEMLNSEFNLPIINVYTTTTNTGGSGGFYLGTKKAIEDSDMIWEMDDDTIPTPTALEELLCAWDKIDVDISFLASAVFGPNGEPMNVPTISSKVSSNGYPCWYRYLDDGIVEIECATLVSLLFNTDAVKKVGGPHPFFFIWGDDIEYTLRMTSHYGKAFFVGTSKVMHKRVGAKNLSIAEEENLNRIKMYKYLFRNNLVNSKNYYSKARFVKDVFCDFRLANRMLFKGGKHSFLKYKTIVSGIIEFACGDYNRKAFTKRFSNLSANYLDEYL